MDNLLQTLLQNLNMNNLKDAGLGNMFEGEGMVNNMFDGCVNYLMSTHLSEEQCNHIIEICQDKLDTHTTNKYIEVISKILNECKTELTSEHPVYKYIDTVSEIKAYVNSDNDINNPKPSVEYVIETNYNDKNITYFYELIYNNIEGKIEIKKSITVSDITNEKSDDEEMESDSDEETEETEDKEMDDDDSINFNDSDCVEKLSELMGWNGHESTVKTLLDKIYTVFEEEETISW
jgi:hypothetical protein